MTLYTFNADTPGVSDCNGNCAVAWLPLYAAEDAVESGVFSIITRADESRQWALQRWALYCWRSDAAPGDTGGQGLSHPSGNTWSVNKS